MFDINQYSIAVYGVPLGYHGEAPASEPDYPEGASSSTDLPDPWADR